MVLLLFAGSVSLGVLALPRFARAQGGTEKPAFDSGADADAAKKGPATDSKKPDAPDAAAATLKKGLRERPKEFSIENPKITEAEWDRWNRGRGRREYGETILAGDLGRDAQAIIRNGIRLQIYALTIPSLRPDRRTDRDWFAQIVSQIFLTLRSAASAKDAAAQRAMRTFMMQEIVARCDEIIDNNFYARLNAAILLGNLYLVEANRNTGSPGEFYTPAFDALMKVLEYPGQSEALKIRAADGLKNAALAGSPALSVQQNVRLGKALIAELANPNAFESYQEVLCDALASINQVLDLNQQPFIVHALAGALFDKNRPLCARAAAAHALGRAHISPSIDLSVLAYGMADLGRQMVEARAEGKHVRRWCIANLILGFRPKDSLEKAQQFGLVERADEPSFQKYKKVVNEAYTLVRPLYVEDCKNPGAAFPPEVSASLVEWLKNNSPQQIRVAPGSPVIVTQQAITKK